MEEVILVDEFDNEIGTIEKLKAHQTGVLHRAFSVVVFNTHGEMLIQKRADCKYHSAGLWTNACCSHPRPGESVQHAAQRRLWEEMGIKTKPEPAYSFIYKAKLANGLTEYELDHVLIATFNGSPQLNPDEAQDWQYIGLPHLKQQINVRPDKFTTWFKLIVNHPQMEALLTTCLKL